MSGATTSGWPYIEGTDKPKLWPPVTRDLADRLEARVRRIDFPTPQTVWTIDLGFPLQITVFDSSGRVVEPGTVTVSGTSYTLTFSAAFSGIAICYG